MYLGEISPADIRGHLTSMLTVAVKLGTLMEYVIGPFLSVQDLALVSLIGPCLFVVIFIWLPESPYHFLRHNDRQKAINSLVQLRDKEDIHEEINNIERSVKADLANESGFRELLFVPGNRRAVIILLCLGGIQQMSGAHAVIQYAQLILDQANTNLEGKYLTMILGVVQVIFTVICLSPLPFTVASELFPTNVKALGSTATLVSINLWGFTVLKLYLIIAGNYGTHVPFWIFTACSLAGALFMLFYVPETKGKTLEQIQKELHNSSKQ
ncbi:sugar transporter erd6-like 6 protein [Lasius niger]|uniref:Sugar transporter erd6-like 6 protein n=1 Tax=Lasius niger TaxID=67767 RepID=A0A0J7NCJ3_LASNI|nr:sugar transporter erd6-like 6 protein [Lasius niger]